jgi:hypothetical protein
MDETFAEELALETDAELVASFNREVGKPGWTSSRGSYLAALRNEFKKRDFDFSAVGGADSLSLRVKIRVNGKAIEPRD